MSVEFLESRGCKIMWKTRRRLFSQLAGIFASAAADDFSVGGGDTETLDA